MSNYVIGDVQGCYASMMALCKHIHFDPKRDTLWFAGDLVNRGPQSLATLRQIAAWSNQGCAQVVLGNHDLHLLALAAGHGRQNKSDTLSEVVSAPDCTTLIDWMRAQPLVLELPSSMGERMLMVHAGILPQWSFDEALALSKEVEAELQSASWTDWMSQLYGNKPDSWGSTLAGMDRQRLIVNVCTRLRMLRSDGSVDLKFKGEPEDAPVGLDAWFRFSRVRSNGKVVFGHWSTLPHIENEAGYCLDTGCVWGGHLTALRLEDRVIFQVPTQDPPVPIDA